MSFQILSKLRLARPRRPSLAAAVLVLAAGLAAAVPAHAGDASAGQAKAQMCNVCHGPIGMSVAPETPNLAGQPAGYLASQLRHFRDGSRKHAVMSIMAKGLSDADIDNLAAWFGSIQVEAKAPDPPR